MNQELTAVAANAILLLVLLFVQQIHHDVAQGIRWTFGTRHEKARSPLAGRIARAVRNHVEGAAIFTPLALAVVVAGLTSETTAGGAMAFVGFRVVYTVSYVAGLPYVRSAMWTGAIVSSVVVGWPLIAPLL